jgi:light-regulated signal transduction histidine kinase (bacteriophytochrome)
MMKTVGKTVRTLRSVSPVHLQYLKNMGVTATMTISLLKGTDLWGLIACHHGAPKFVPYDVRAACVMFSTVMSAQLVLKEQALLEQQRAELRRIHAALLREIASEDDVLASLTAHADRLMELVRAEGLAILLSRKLRLLGRTPEKPQVAEILVFLNKHGTDFFHSHDLSVQLPTATAYKDTASGLLALSFGRGNYLLFFRPEVVHTLRWAGDPHKPATTNDGSTRLLPRQSFAAWLQTVHQQSLPWSEAELEIAREFHSALTVFILRRSEELERLNRELLAKNQEMEQFVYTVSHDLKSPLVTCMGYIGMMEEDLSDGNLDEVRDSARRIRGAAEKMSHLIDDLLELSRVGRHGHKPCLLESRALVEELIAERAERFEQKHVRVEIQPGLPAVHADETGLTRTLENLLENALKYGCDGPDPVITIGGDSTDEEVRLFVRDSGPGIAEEYHQKIFRLFQRLDPTKEGTGVGLASVAKIMSMHKGRAWVESTPGQGATFWLAFPHDS